MSISTKLIEFFARCTPTGQPRVIPKRWGKPTHDTTSTQGANCAMMRATCEAEARRALDQCLAKMEPGPVVVQLLVFFDRPKSHWIDRAAGRLRKSAPEHHAKRPDCDNIAKAVLDSMNGATYRDDAQVVFLAISKHWATASQPPGVLVRVRQATVLHKILRALSSAITDC